jgi:hypothetical protein
MDSPTSGRFWRYGGQSDICSSLGSNPLFLNEIDNLKEIIGDLKGKMVQQTVQ